MREARSYKSFSSQPVSSISFGMKLFHYETIMRQNAMVGRMWEKIVNKADVSLWPRSRENWGFIIVHTFQYVLVIYFLQPRLTSYCSHLPKIPSNYGFMSKFFLLLFTSKLSWCNHFPKCFVWWGNISDPNNNKSLAMLQIKQMAIFQTVDLKIMPSGENHRIIHLIC